MRLKNKQKREPRPETWAERERRLSRNQRSREKRWRKTGPSDETINWLKERNWV